ncbi:MAG: hypothetical protein HY965_09065, partial [Ignavibacteriales bacterium]|nr:hypothetical protein [Ignavibacteriales bacterium]
MKNKDLLLLIRSQEDQPDMDVLRWRRFRKHLERKGWKIHWISVQFPEKAQSGGFLKRLMGKLVVLRHAYRAANWVIASRNISVVIVTIPYATPMILGVVLKIKLRDRIKLILEIRDIYARNTLICSRRICGFLNVIKENIFLAYADSLWYVTTAIKDHYIKFYPCAEKILRGAVITNGFDSEEYPKMVTFPSERKFLVINYFGAFYGYRNPEL